MHNKSNQTMRCSPSFIISAIVLQFTYGQTAIINSDGGTDSRSYMRSMLKSRRRHVEDNVSRRILRPKNQKKTTNSDLSTPSLVSSYISSSGPSLTPQSASPSPGTTNRDQKRGPKKGVANDRSLSDSPSTSSMPSLVPSNMPTIDPSATASSSPSSVPSDSPSPMPSSIPSRFPSFAPSTTLSFAPSSTPTTTPSSPPSPTPSKSPSIIPSIKPSPKSSVHPSTLPTTFPSLYPSPSPTTVPTVHPSTVPSPKPSIHPSPSPTTFPSVNPSHSPTMVPSIHPSSMPSPRPSFHPSPMPSTFPSVHPSLTPTAIPSTHPSVSPSTYPSSFPTMEPRNLVARCGCATQSSTFVDTDFSRFQSAYKAIDGRNKYSFDQSAVTAKEFNPFWQVDLQVDSFIDEIVIYSTDNEKAKLQNFKVTVTDKDKKVIPPEYWHTESIPPASSFAIDHKYHGARYVIISMEGQSVVLALSQVEVTGTNDDPSVCTNCQAIYFDQCESSISGTSTNPYNDPFLSWHNIRVRNRNRDNPSSSWLNDSERLPSNDVVDLNIGGGNEITMKCEDGAFNLRSLWITPAIPTVLDVTIEGRKQGSSSSSTIESYTVTLENPYMSTFLDLNDFSNFVGLDSVVIFSPRSSNRHAGVGTSRSRSHGRGRSTNLFSIDDIYVEITSECKVSGEISPDCPLESFIYDAAPLNNVANDVYDVDDERFDIGVDMDSKKDSPPAVHDDGFGNVHATTDVGNNDLLGGGGGDEDTEEESLLPPHDLREGAKDEEKELTTPHKSSDTTAAFQKKRKKSAGKRKGKKQRKAGKDQQRTKASKKTKRNKGRSMN